MSMSSADLMKMLGLTGDAPAGPGIEIVATESTTKKGVPATPAQPTALDMDRWAIGRGKDVLKANAELRALSLGKDAALAVADFHAAAFEPRPTLNAKCVDPLRLEFMQRLLESPEYQAMRQETMLHETCSEIAALSIAKQFAALRVERNADEQGSPPPGPNGQPGNIQGEVKMIRAIAEAVNDAAEKVSEVREAEAMVGHGPGAESKLSAASIGKLVCRVRHSARLKRICELAGRYRRLAQSKQQAKQTHGYDDMVGVQLDGDVGRLVPTELAQLFDEDLELDAMRRIVERQAMCWEYRGVDQSAKGPIIVMVDESSSMSRHGKIEMAKALALALAYIARTQQRWCALVGWSSAGMVNSLALPPGAWNEQALLAWLEHFWAAWHGRPARRHAGHLCPDESTSRQDGRHPGHGRRREHRRPVTGPVPRLEDGQQDADDHAGHRRRSRGRHGHRERRSPPDQQPGRERGRGQPRPVDLTSTARHHISPPTRSSLWLQYALASSP